MLDLPFVEKIVQNFVIKSAIIRMSGEGEKFIAALDVGTTTIRCLVIDQNGVVRGEEKLNVSF